MKETTLQSASQLIGRALVSAIFIMAGLTKITGYSATQGYMESVGLPGMLLPLVILLEVGGGMAILLGWKTRIAAILLAGFSVLSALIFHNNLGDQMQSILFMKNLAMAGGLLFIFSSGAGAWSIDNKRSLTADHNRRLTV